MEKRRVTLEAEYLVAKSVFEVDLRNVRQKLSEKTTELEGMILALNDARQQISNLQHEVEKQKQMKREKVSLNILLISIFDLQMTKFWLIVAIVTRRFFLFDSFSDCSKKGKD